MFARDPELRIGTSSWSSKDWVGPFYPPGTRPERFIEHYATRFDTVEIDATFYRMPTSRNVSAWRSRTPDGFRFAVKTPRSITHDKVLVDADDEMRIFLDIIAGLGERLGPILLQFPYFNKKAFACPAPFLDRLDTFLAKLPKELPFAVEVRNKPWVSPALALCKQHRVALAFIEQAWMPKAHEWGKRLDELPTSFAYVRWLGDHKAIEELTSTWNKLVIDKTDILKSWAGVIRGIREKNVKVFGFFNNHFAGYGPGSIEMFEEIYRQTR